MAYQNCISDRLEEACQAFYNARIAAGDLTLTSAGNVRISFSNDTLSGSYILFMCEEAERDFTPDGPWSARLAMHVVTNADDTTQPDHRQRFGEALSWFKTGTMPADLSALAEPADLTVMEIYERGQMKRIEGRKWTSIQNYLVKCTGIDGQ